MHGNIQADIQTILLASVYKNLVHSFLGVYKEKKKMTLSRRMLLENPTYADYSMYTHISLHGGDI